MLKYPEAFLQKFTCDHWELEQDWTKVVNATHSQIEAPLGEVIGLLVYFHWLLLVYCYIRALAQFDDQDKRSPVRW